MRSTRSPTRPLLADLSTCPSRGWYWSTRSIWPRPSRRTANLRRRRGGMGWLWASAKTGTGLSTVARRPASAWPAPRQAGEGVFSARRRHVQALQQSGHPICNGRPNNLTRSAQANSPPKNSAMHSTRSARSPVPTAATICSARSSARILHRQVNALANRGRGLHADSA